MKLEDIKKSWREDVKINPDKLDEEASKNSSLHSKYYEIYIHERLILKKLHGDLKKLEKAKYIFFTQGPSKEQIEDGWVLPARGKIMKPDVGRYMTADQDIQNLELKIEHQECKVEFLFSIIAEIKSRGFNIKNAIEYIRFQTGF